MHHNVFYILGGLVAVALLGVWLLRDRLVYHGPAYALSAWFNNRRSTAGYFTVNSPSPLLANLVGDLPEHLRTGKVKQRVVFIQVRKRAFQKPRITSVS